jgi:tripartite-type tricarboxylate transporter receptor subunit TctC
MNSRIDPRIVAAGLGLALTLSATPSVALAADDDYPGHTITMIVPFPPGGAADIVARPIAESMSRHLKQAVVILNRPGAGGGVGMAYVARAKADGYTVLMALSSIVVLPEADKVRGQQQMFQLNQLIPVARFSADPVVLAVRADSPWKTLKDFLAAVKAQPNKYTYGSSGNYGTMHVPMVQLLTTTGTTMVHVPYTGAAPAVNALMGSTVDAVATGPSTISAYVHGGQLRALAEWGDKPIPSLPDVATLKSQGVPVTYTQWAGLFVPAGTPAAIIDRLRDASREAANDPVAIKSLQTQGTEMQYLDQDDFTKFVDGDAKAMADVVRRIGKVE